MLRATGMRSVVTPLMVTALMCAVLPHAAAGQGQQEQRLDRLPDVQAPPRGTINRLVGAPDPRAQSQDYTRYVASRLDGFWQQHLAAAGVQYGAPTLQIVPGATQVTCANESYQLNQIGPFYCPSSRTVVIPEEYWASVRNQQLATPGDFGAAYVIAHEYAHHVQNILGIWNQTISAEAANPSLSNRLAIRFELQADCLAGVWSRYTFQQGQLEPGDIEEAQASAAQHGDDPIPYEQWRHGDSKTRVAWLMYGYSTGDPSQCKTFDDLSVTRVAVGGYQLTIPQGVTYQQLQNGQVTVQTTWNGVALSGQIGGEQLAPAAASNHLASGMQRWNPQQPMRAYGQPVPMDQATQHLGGNAIGQWYEQQYQDPQGRPAVVHGLYTIQIRNTGQAVVVDVWSLGPAQSAQDWQLLGNFAVTLINGLRTQ
ncbi:MAG TPA: neutral zinc metallopeptidase [Gemmatimonadaceae bacterium]|nr:neutral zinc metallopeptidase [Gemmatimonadaceae bacterium]